MTPDGADRSGPIAYRRSVSAFFSRIVPAFVLFAALAWIVLPAAVFASPRAAHVEGEACPCCDGPATVGPIVACPGCQAATPVDGGLPISCRTFTAAWIETSDVYVTGLDPAPAEPPPR